MSGRISVARGVLTLVAGIIVCGAWMQSVHAGTTSVEIGIDGYTALGDLVVPDDGSMADGVVLITHGTLAHKDMELVEGLQTLLAERGVASLAHSLTLGIDRRKGMYDCAQVNSHRHEDAVEEIGAWVKWLRANGASRISLFGHSRGGNQVSWFAAEQNKFDKLILLAPAMGASAADTAAGFQKRFKAELGPLLDQARTLVKAGKGSEFIDMPGFVYCGASKATAASVVSYYGSDPRMHTTSLLSEIARPILVIAGSADTVVPDVARRIGQLGAKKNISLKIIEDAGHMFLDFYSEDAADLIAEFVAQQSN